MDVSFKGIGEWAATFTGSGLKKGQVVKPSANGAVAACADGDKFCGVVLQCSGNLCAVQLGGLATVVCSGAVPGVGVAPLAGDGQGGVKTVATGGNTYLVAAADGDTITIKL